jgi:hypothetical protein
MLLQSLDRLCLFKYAEDGCIPGLVCLPSDEVQHLRAGSGLPVMAGDVHLDMMTERECVGNTFTGTLMSMSQNRSRTVSDAVCYFGRQLRSSKPANPSILPVMYKLAPPPPPVHTCRMYLVPQVNPGSPATPTWAWLPFTTAAPPPTAAPGTALCW